MHLRSEHLALVRNYFAHQFLYPTLTVLSAIGFVLAYACLKIYIDPSKTPLIESDDPRWMGGESLPLRALTNYQLYVALFTAWWLGWVFLGIAMLLVAGLVGLFPKELPKKRKQNVR